MQTGTIKAKEFYQRQHHEGPVPLETLQVKPSELIVAPGNFATATRQHEQ
jgi:hypothetical protein